MLVFLYTHDTAQCAISLSLTYYMEFLSSKFRGIASSTMTLFWVIGTISTALLALAIMPNCKHMPDIHTVYTSHSEVLSSRLVSSPLNWRLYVALCPLPMVIVLISFIVSLLTM